MDYIELAPCIRQYTLSSTDLTKLEHYINVACGTPELWQSSTTLGLLDDYRTSMSLHITHRKYHEPWLSELDSFVYTLFNTAASDYQKDFHLRIATDEGYEVLRYGIGQGYKRHIDQGSFQFGRILSGLLYVNDNYSGGQLEFLKFNLTIQPVRGTIVLFPSNFAYEHVAHPVTDGHKIAIVTFFHPYDEIEFEERRRTKLDPHGAFNL